MLESLLAPRSVAVIGASRQPGKVGHELLANLCAGGYGGRLIPVNPLAEEILGLPSVATPAQWGAPPDLALLVVPAVQVLESAAAALRAGAKALAVISAGFAESGADGLAREQRLAELCRQRGAPLLGPNCLGVMNAPLGLNAAFAGPLPPAGEVAVVTQSGAVGAVLMEWLRESGLGLSKMVSIGNKAGVDEAAFLHALATDDETRVIVLYLESIANGEAFIAAAEAAGGRKPVVLIKAGVTEAGGRAALSHTGAMTGPGVAYGAAFKRAGVVRADNFEALQDAVAALARQPLPLGERVAVVTNAGGPGILAADALERAGLAPGRLSGGRAAALRQKLPVAAQVGHPIDVLGDAGPERYGLAVGEAQLDEAVDALLVLITPQAMTRPEACAQACAEACALAVEEGGGAKPLLAVAMGGAGVAPARLRFQAAGIPHYPTPERAVAALRAMRDYAVWRQRPVREVMRFPVNRRRVERLLTRHRRAGQGWVAEPEAKEILAAYGFAVPGGERVADVEEALAAASRLGYPVALKVVSPDIPHKSDAGGVHLRLASAAAVRDAFDLVMLRTPRRLPGARVEMVYVERMAPPGREVVLGMVRDREFGPMLMFGLGGVLVEVLRDVAFHLAPITHGEALEMLRSTRSYAVLRGARGQDPTDLEAIAEGLQRVSQLATDFPQIAELDINPLVVGPTGREPVVADARLVLRWE